jgi:anti-sigma factor RsiW
MESRAVELVCREIVELVSEYLGGTLSPEETVRFDQHLSACPPCTVYLAEVKTTLELAAELGSAKPTGAPSPDAVGAELAEVFRRWHGKRQP